MNTEINCQSCKHLKNEYCEVLESKPCYPQKGCDYFSKSDETKFIELFKEIEGFRRSLREYREQTLAEIITKYDFVVGSVECKLKLMEILPEEANIIYLPYIESPTMVYAIKKFNAMELLFESQESEVQK